MPRRLSWSDQRSRISHEEPKIGIVPWRSFELRLSAEDKPSGQTTSDGLDYAPPAVLTLEDVPVRGTTFAKRRQGTTVGISSRGAKFGPSDSARGDTAVAKRRDEA